jgi:SAM-dependent methyltransferase
MQHESVRDFYNRQYSEHLSQGRDCPHAIHDLAKARRRVARVAAGLGVPAGGRVLDVGSGLGFYTKALSDFGGETTGLDFSEAAISAARLSFPDCRFVCGAWPDGVAREPQYDLIWMVNFSLMNTFDVGFIRQRLVNEALARLKTGGCLVVGWNTDLSGIAKHGYSNWSASTLREMRLQCGLSAPFVPIPLGRLASAGLLGIVKPIGRSVPIFMVRRKGADGP